MTDIFVIGLGALSLVTVLIFVLTSKTRDRDMRDDDNRQSS